MAQAIQDESLVAVTDGSYIKQLYPNICSAAFILESRKGRGRIVGSFKEATAVANAYRGELLGLMAIHLLLVSINRMHASLSGSVKVVSDCLGALRCMVDLPPYRIPSRCRHLDILKNILVNCRDLTFNVHYSHVRAHQDDNTLFNKLSRNSQLNCICDHLPKQCISDGEFKPRGSRLLFPLEPIGITVGGEKLSSKTGDLLWFHAHRQLARTFFHQRGILTWEAFNKVDWESLHKTLHAVPRLFQVWASKHVLRIAGTINSSPTKMDEARSVPAARRARKHAPT